MVSFFSFFLWLRQMVLRSWLGEWLDLCLGGVLFFGRFYCLFFFQMFDTRSTLARWFPLDMRPLAGISVAVRSCCRSHRSRRSPEFGAWPAHTRGVYALRRAWQSRFTIFWSCTVGRGLPAVFFRLGGTGVGAWAGIGEIRLSFCRLWVVASVLCLLFQSTFVIFGHFGIFWQLLARSVSLLCAIVLYCLEGLHV
jgi:hypothetical protein